MRGNPWAFGIVFVAGILYLFWNNFELPTVFFGETSSTNAVIIKNQPVPGFGSGRRQMVTFSFRAQDSLYTYKKKLSPRKEYQYID